MKYKFNPKISLPILTLLSGLGACKNGRTNSDLLLETGVTSSTLPIKWMVVGDRNSGGATSGDGCPTGLFVPPKIQDTLERAWGEAEGLLKGRINRNQVIVSTNDTDDVEVRYDESGVEIPVAIADVANYNGGIGLISIDVIVEGENVSVVKGCIGTEKPSETLIAAKETAQAARVAADPIPRQCWETSKTTGALKEIDLKNALNAECPSGGVNAGFALRTNTRSVSLSSRWQLKQKRELRTFPEGGKITFDYSTVDFFANANADASGFAAAVLPLPPGAKKVAGALMDKLGTLSFGAEHGNYYEIIPDEFNRPVKASGQKLRKVSNLAIAIAKDILKPLCLRAVDLEIEADRNNCELDEAKLLRQTDSAAHIDKYYRKVAINACDGQMLKAILYAKFRKPQVIPDATDPATGKPIMETDFLVNPEKTRMAVWRATGNISSALKYLEDAIYKGPAQNPQKCGNINPNTERCAAFEMKSLPGSGLDCGKINSKQASAYLSFLRDSGSMNATDQ